MYQGAAFLAPFLYHYGANWCILERRLMPLRVELATTATREGEYDDLDVPPPVPSPAVEEE